MTQIIIIIILYQSVIYLRFMLIITIKKVKFFNLVCKYILEFHGDNFFRDVDIIASNHRGIRIYKCFISKCVS